MFINCCAKAVDKGTILEWGWDIRLVVADSIGRTFPWTGFLATSWMSFYETGRLCREVDYWRVCDLANGRSLIIASQHNGWFPRIHDCFILITTYITTRLTKEPNHPKLYWGKFPQTLTFNFVGDNFVTIVQSMCGMTMWFWCKRNVVWVDLEAKLLNC